ncbi:LOW QUALITY PROTEIN: protein IQ-DOMAIN 22-like [Primulina eburnea]|uniref:LOW QUALITY PROTEIN: protein IQ-DOMAIN 22-like n=1 Tax=Primulina eburnea TaxID=1245227 RepID=UPI003C6BE100
MGKASKWFRALLGLKKSDPNPNTRQIWQPPKKKWSFAKSHMEKSHLKSQHVVVTNDNDPSHHAVAVAAATAAVAEAAVAAAEAAAVVVKLTSGSGRSTSTSTAACVSKTGAGRWSRKERAAVTIQSDFRAYLSRRALWTLKALVKLQALVRGHLVRKQTADVLRRMQALVRAQARARAGRFWISESPYPSLKSSHFSYHGPLTPEKIDHVVRTRSMKHEQLTTLKRKSSRSSGNVSLDAEKLPTNCNRLDCRLGDRSLEQGLRTGNGPTDDERSYKILEVDTGKPFATNCETLFRASHPSLGSDLNCQRFSTSKDSTLHSTVLSSISGEVKSLSSMKFAKDIDESAFCTAENSPQLYSASSMGGISKRGALTPSKSDGSRSCLNGYTDHPNYMSFTESSKAKARSLSAPKQRLQYDRSGSTKRYLVHGCHESRLIAHRVSALDANFTIKAYPGSGRLDRLGMPTGEGITGFRGGQRLGC